MGITADQVKEICSLGKEKGVSGTKLIQMIKELRTYEAVKEKLVSLWVNE